MTEGKEIVSAFNASNFDLALDESNFYLALNASNQKDIDKGKCLYRNEILGFSILFLFSFKSCFKVVFLFMFGSEKVYN